MERLTIRNSDGSVSQPLNLKWAEALERLAAYEDTGLTPEEVSDLLTIHRGMEGNEYVVLDDELRSILFAKNEGRLLVLPCEVGEIVWLIDERFCARGRERWPLVRCKINEFVMVGEAAFAVLDGAESWYSVSRFKALSVRDFGKTVFLTREEAEAALKGEGNG